MRMMSHWQRCIAFSGIFLLAACTADLTDIEHVQRAKDFQDEGDLVSAIIELKNAANKNPNNPEARLLLGRIYLSSQNSASAEKELEKAIQLGVNDPSVKLDFYESLLKQQKYEVVINELSEFKFPNATNSARALALIGNAQLGNQQMAVAAKLLNESLTTQDNAAARVGLIKLQVLNNETSETKKLVDETIRLYPGDFEVNFAAASYYAEQQNDLVEAKKLISKALDVTPDVNAKLYKADLLVQLGEIEAAEAEASQVLQIYPTYSTALYTKANILYRKKSFDEARDILEKIIATAPGHASSLLLLGSIYYEKEQYERALQLLRKYGQQYPHSKDAAKLIADIQIRNNELDFAENTIWPILKRYPDDAEVLRLAAEVMLKQGRTEDSVPLLQKLVEMNQAEGQAKLYLAMNLYARGEQEKAADLLQNVVDADTSDVLARSLLMRVYLEGRNYPKAMELAEVIKKASPEETSGWNYEGLVYLQEGNVNLAKERFARALVIDPSNPEANNQLALIARQESDDKKAHEHYEAIFKKYPNHFLGRMARASLYAKQLNQAAAIADIELAREENPNDLQSGAQLASYYLRYGQSLEALSLLRRLHSLYPDNPFLHAALVKAHLKLGLNKEAQSLVNSLSVAFPQAADVLALKAKVLMFNGRVSEAEKVLQQALRIDKESIEVQLELVRLQIIEKKYELARVSTNRLLQQNEENHEVIARAGDLAFAQGNFAEAIDSFKKSLTLYADSEVIGSLGKAYWQLGDRDAMFKIWAGWLQQFPKDRDTRYLKVVAHRMQGDVKEEIESLKQIVLNNPSDLIALNELAWGLRKTDFDSALTFGERALKLAPEDPQIMDTLAMVLAEQKRYARSIELLRQAVKLAPNNTTFSFHLAQIYFESGASREAQSILNLLLERAEPFAEKEPAAALLKKIEGGAL